MFMEGKTQQIFTFIGKEELNSKYVKKKKT